MLNKINISPGKQKLIVYIVLTVVTLAVYWQVNQYGFVNFDDHVYVTQNIHIQSGITLDGCRWAMGTHFFGLWNPLVWLSFMFDYQLYGLNAGGYHLTNLILHILSALLLFWLFNRMTGAIWRSAFVAAIFALHPLHVESVAWICRTQRCPERLFLDADPVPLCLLHRETDYKKISACCVFLCLSSYEQAHGCHFACYFDSSGLLAA